MRSLALLTAFLLSVAPVQAQLEEQFKMPLKRAEDRMRKAADAYGKLGEFGVSSFDVQTITPFDLGGNDTTAEKKRVRASGFFGVQRYAVRAEQTNEKGLNKKHLRSLYDGKIVYRSVDGIEAPLIPMKLSDPRDKRLVMIRVFNSSPGLMAISTLARLKTSIFPAGGGSRISAIYLRDFPDGGCKISANISVGDNGTGGNGTMVVWLSAEQFLQKIEADVPVGDSRLTFSSLLSRPYKITTPKVFEWNTKQATIESGSSENKNSG